jgi:transposase
MEIWAKESDRHPEGYSYPRFRAFYTAFEYQLTPMLRQQRHAGEVAYVGFTEATIPWLDLSTGVEEEAELFFGVLGYSYYTFLRATKVRSPKEWFDLHGQMFESFGGVPAVIAPGYIQASSPGRDLAFTEAYEDLAIHYRTHILPEFPYAPQTGRDVPMAVRVATQWIAWRLRKLKFKSIEEINVAIKPLLAQLHEKPFKRLPGCRASWFQEVERPVLKPLPARSYRERLTMPLVPPEPSGDEEWLRNCTEGWARSIGPNASAFVRLLFDRYPLPKALEFCKTLRGLAHRFGEARFEMACQRTRVIGKPTMKSVRALLRQVVNERAIAQGLTVIPTSVDGGNSPKGDDHGQHQH